MAAMTTTGTNLPPSPPQSVARSSTGLYSERNSGGRKYSMQAMEVELQEHHRVLRDFLNQSIREDRAYQPHNRARDKLLRLSAIQFQELSTDVYDELLRREDERRLRDTTQTERQVPRFLLPKQNFHPKRNQARQKLSTLASKKFRELATDVLFELERRVPRFAQHSIDRVSTASPISSTGRVSFRDGPVGSPRSRPGTGVSGGIPSQYDNRQSNGISPTGPYSPGGFSTASGASGEFGRPLAKQFQSNTMVPNKSTMVEDDDEEGDTFDVHGNRPRSRPTSARRLTGGSGTTRLRDSTSSSDYEAKITRLEQKLTGMEMQLKDKDDEVRAIEAEKSRMIEAEQTKSSNLLSDLERQVNSAEMLNKDLNVEVARLKAANSEIEARLQSHETARSNVDGEMERLRQLNAQYQDQLLTYQDLGSNHDALQTDFEELRDVHGQMQAQLGDHQELQNQHQELQSAHAQLQAKLSGFDDLRQEQLGDYQDLQNQHRELQSAHTQLQEKLGGYDDLRQEQLGDHQDLQNQHRELQSAHAQLQEQLSGYDDLRQEQLGHHLDLQNQHRELQSAHTQLQGAHAQLHSTHTQLQEKMGGYDDLQQEHTALREVYIQSQRDAQTERDTASASAEWQSRFEGLDRRYQNQTKVVAQVRAESAQTLQDLQMLSSAHDAAEDEREGLVARIAQLERSVDDWRSRYSRAKTQRGGKATSTALSIEQPDLSSGKHNGFRAPGGLVADTHVAAFQTCVTELLRLARGDEHATVFKHMRPLVTAVKAVVDDVDGGPPVSEEVARQRGKLKKTVSRTANTLTTTCKTFAGSEGVAPVGLVDAAAADLTGAVVELLRVVGVRETGAEEEGDGILEDYA